MRQLSPIHPFNWLFCLLAAAPVSLAQNTPNASNTPDVQSVTITASRVPRQLSDLATSVSQINSFQLEQQLDLSSNILESLDVLVPGLTTSQEEARSGCRTNIRGRQAQFLINGVPTNDNLRQSSCSSLYALSPFAVENIDVLRGATSVYGAGAPGGAINLQTRQARSTDLSVDFLAQHSINPHEVSDSGESNAYIGAGQLLDGWDFYTGLGVQDYGVRRNPNGDAIQGSTFRSYSINTSFGFNISETQNLRFTGLYYDENPRDLYGTDFTQISGENLASEAFIATPPNPYGAEAGTEQSVFTLSYDNADFLNQTLNVALYWHDEEIIQRAVDFFEGSVYYFDSDAENERQGLRTTLNWQKSLGEGELDVTYGVDILKQRYYRPVVDPSSGHTVIDFVAPEVELDSTAIFFQPQYQVGKWLFVGGVRHESFDGKVGSKGYMPDIPNAATPGDTPDFDLSLYNLGVIYDLTDQMQIFGGFNQGAEISEFGRAARGNPDPTTINLDAAASDQYELGLRGRSGMLDFSLSGFYSHSDKAANLQADPSCAGQQLCPLIPLRLEREIQGAEVTADWNIQQSIRLGTILTWQKGESKERGLTPVPLGTDALTPFRSTFYTSWDLGNLQARIQATYHAETDIYDAAEEAAGFRDADSVFLVDLNISYPVGPGSISLGVANLLNEKYVNVTNQGSGDFFYYLSEGTRATLGYNIRF